MSTYNFIGKIALVTGGGGGIGRACCQVLAREGARLVVADVDLEAAQQTLTTLPGGQQHVAVAVDVRDMRSVEEAMKSARDQCGAPPSLLVNCAGVFSFTPVSQPDDEAWQKIIDVNLKGTFLATQVFATSLLKSGEGSKGVVVNIASIFGKTGYPETSAYSASKGGVISLTKTCAQELASKAIRVNAVLPGFTDTKMLDAADEESLQKAIRLIPLGRLARPEGGGNGIGRACCQVLAREGARLVVADVDLEAAQQTLTTLTGGQQHVAVAVDVRHMRSVEEAMKSARDQCGAPPSLLVNCAGVFSFTPVSHTEDETWQKIIDVNLKGIFLVTQVFATSLLKSGEGSKGVVVNISSIFGKTGFPESSAYSATKGGVISLTKTCAQELASKAIRVNAVLPGFTDTKMLDVADEEPLQKVIQLTPLHRLARPEEIAEVVAFLLSERSSYMVGACVEVTGGYAM